MKIYDKLLIGLTIIILAVNMIIIENSNNSEMPVTMVYNENNEGYTLSQNENYLFLKRIDENKKILWERIIEAPNSFDLSISNMLVTKSGDAVISIYINNYFDESAEEYVEMDQVYLYDKNNGNEKKIYEVKDNQNYDEEKRNLYNTYLKDIFCYDNTIYFCNETKNIAYYNDENDYDLTLKYNIETLDLNDSTDTINKLNEIEYKTLINTSEEIVTKEGDILFTDRHSNIYKIKNDGIINLLHESNKEFIISELIYDNESNVYFKNTADGKNYKLDSNTNEIKLLENQDDLNNNDKKIVNATNFYTNRTFDMSDLKYSFNAGIKKYMYDYAPFFIFTFVIWIARYIIMGNIFRKKESIIVKQAIVFIIILLSSTYVIFFAATSLLQKVVNNQKMEKLTLSMEEFKNTIDSSALGNIDWDNVESEESYEIISKYILNMNHFLDINTNTNTNSKSTYNFTLYKVKNDKIYSLYNEQIKYDGIPIKYLALSDEIPIYEKAVAEKRPVYAEFNNIQGIVMTEMVPLIDDDNNVVAIIEGNTPKEKIRNVIEDCNAKDIVKVNLGVSGVIMTVIIAVLYMLLRPLKKLEQGAGSIIEGNFGVVVNVKSNDEVGHIADAFNEMSVELKKQIDKLNRYINMNCKFIPKNVIKLFGVGSVTKLKRGDSAQINIPSMSLKINDVDDISASLNDKELFIFINQVFGLTVPIISDNNGVVESYNNSGFISLFNEKAEDAVVSALKIFRRMTDYNKIAPRKTDITCVINKEQLTLGIIGSYERTKATVVSDYINIVSDINDFAYKFGVSILLMESCVKNEEDILKKHNSRYLGYVKYSTRNELVKIYDLYEAEDSIMKELKDRTKDIFEEGVNYFINREISKAKRCFIQVLKICNNDKAAKEYLVLCDKYYEKHTDVFIKKF